MDETEIDPITSYNDRLMKMLDQSYLETKTMEEIYDKPYKEKKPIIDGLLYPCTYLFVGAPKLGKSFMMMQLAYHVSTGTPLWNYPVNQGDVLYLALEDDYSNTGGYVWRESHTATKAQIMQYMNNAMSNGEIAQCTIKNITFSVTPAPRAPGDTSTAEKFSVEGTIEVEIPYDFAWSSLAPMRYTLEVKSEWKAKF